MKILILFVCVLLQTKVYAQSSEVIAINGGSDEHNNSPQFSVDAHTFASKFDPKKTKIIILDGGGPKSKSMIEDKSPTCKNCIARDEVGHILYEENKNSHEAAATYQNTMFALFGLEESGNKPAVIYFGDHGEPEAVDLWKSELNYETLRKEYQKMPKDKLIRVIHDHCFAGAALVNPSRGIPSSIEDVDLYLDKYYPANRCAFSASDSDEVGWTDASSSSPGLITSAMKKANSLKGLKERVEDDDYFISSPKLTSDYFLTDATSYICGKAGQGFRKDKWEVPYIEQCSTQNLPRGDIYGLGQSAAFAMTEALCKNTTKCKNEDKDVRRDMRSKYENDYAHDQCYIQIFKDEYPTEYKIYRKELDQYQAAIQDCIKTGIREVFCHDYVHNRRQKISGFMDIFENSKGVLKKISDCTDQRIDKHKLQTSQLKRKNCLNGVEKENREILRQLFALDNRLKPWKERYENLQSCESSALR